MEEQNRELIPELNKFFEHYRIRALVIDYHGVRNQLCAEAMGIRFVVEPFNGKADWELLFLKLERWKNGNKRDIRRAREGEVDETSTPSVD